jgi:hypothetical protein
MKDLLEALGILSKYAPENARSPLCCTHDQLWIMDVDPEKVSDADVARLDQLGFFIGDEGFISFRFGSA